MASRRSEAGTVPPQLARHSIRLRSPRLALLGLLLLCLPLPGLGDERILSYESLIRVEPSGDLEVIETLRVRAEGRDIRRGVYRDFPTDYRDRYRNRYRVGFELLGVSRDGRPEAHRLERRSNGVRIYAGDADVHLSPGTYEYVFRYRTNRQLGYFAEHDELYWNVTGNEWAFPIDAVRAEVLLPDTVRAATMSVEGYTGPAGAQGRDYRAGIAADANAWIETSRPLAPREGLTLVVTWPKGHVTEPTRADRVGHLLSDNRGLIAGLAGLATLLIYYLAVWRRYGRDPAAGVVIPHYAPAAGFSPASMRFIRRMGYDHRTFAAATLNLAAGGKLRIDKTSGDYALERLEGSLQGVAAGERALMRELFARGERIELEKGNHATISRALKAHERALEVDYERQYFRTNSLWVLPGVVLSIGIVLATFLLSPSYSGAPAVPLVVGVSIGAFVLVGLGGSLLHAWRTARTLKRIGIALKATLAVLPLLAAGGWGFFELIDVSSWLIIFLLVALVATNVLFYQLLKAPTLAGRRLLDKIDGFRMYLDIAEKDDLALKNPPQKTPELFERYLPFALALDVEQAWAEQFADVFAAFRTEHGRDYQPNWYDGRWDASRPGRFTQSLTGGLTSAISSSSTPPGSSSGAGGGGSSGGGGGGGGGGGW